MAASAGGRSGYRRCLVTLLVVVLLLMVMMAPAGGAGVVPPEVASSLAAKHTCRDVFVECQAGVANKACCTAISKKIREHYGWGRSCVCRRLRGKQCRLPAKCSKVYCPNCAPCNMCSLDDQDQGPIV